MLRSISFLLSAILVVFYACEQSNDQALAPLAGISPEELEAGFLNPPIEAKPRTWFHAMSGNMSKEGITKDLESMAEVG
ncbi:MAG: glycosyl hydrolase, partial [Bacteroidota bacterium]